MQETIKFSCREEFRKWLQKNCRSNSGVWLIFGKPGSPETIKASEALEEALCFGWIDGQLQSIDETAYKKYFSVRRPNSKWSAKNKALAQRLESAGRMTGHDRQKIVEAKRNGQWNAPPPTAATEGEIAFLTSLLKGYEPALTNFPAMSLSVKKTYTRACFDAKTQTGRTKRLLWIVDRLNINLKPM